MKIKKRLLALTLMFSLMLSMVSFGPFTVDSVASTDAVVDVWDGSSVVEPLLIGNYYVIDSAAKLAYVRENWTVFSDSKLKLDANIAMNANYANSDTWTPSSTGLNNWFAENKLHGSGASAFRGEFDGGGYTIYGIYYSAPGKQTNHGFIGAIDGSAYVHDVNLKNSAFFVSNLGNSGFDFLGFVGQSTGFDTVIENVSVDAVFEYPQGTNYGWGRSGGGILGAANGSYEGSKVTVDGCTFTGSVYAPLAGGIVGCFYGDNKTPRNSVLTVKNSLVDVESNSINALRQYSGLIGAVVKSDVQNFTVNIDNCAVLTNRRLVPSTFAGIETTTTVGRGTVYNYSNNVSIADADRDVPGIHVPDSYKLELTVSVENLELKKGQFSFKLMAGDTQIGSVATNNSRGQVSFTIPPNWSYREETNVQYDLILIKPEGDTSGINYNNATVTLTYGFEQGHTQVATKVIAQPTASVTFTEASISVWDGFTVTAPAQEGDYYIVDSAAKLAFIRENWTNFKEAKIKLVENIAMNANYANSDSWTASSVGLNNWFAENKLHGSGASAFRGEFDGGGYTIYGIYYSAPGKQTNHGFIGAIDGSAYVHDVNLKNSAFFVSNLGNSGFDFLGFVGQSTGSNTVIENVSVDAVFEYPQGTNYGWGRSGGGILGAANGSYEGSKVTVDGCTFTGSVYAPLAGGIVGCFYGDNKTPRNSVLTVKNSLVDVESNSINALRQYSGLIGAVVKSDVQNFTVNIDNCAVLTNRRLVPATFAGIETTTTVGRGTVYNYSNNVSIAEADRVVEGISVPDNYIFNATVDAEGEISAGQYTFKLLQGDRQICTRTNDASGNVSFTVPPNWSYRGVTDVEFTIVPVIPENDQSGRAYINETKVVLTYGFEDGHTIAAIAVTDRSPQAVKLAVYSDQNGTYYIEDGERFVGEKEINGNYYLFGEDGYALTGVQKLSDGKYWDFGQDGICDGIYTGVVFENQQLYYAKNGLLVSGWIEVGGEWYYYNPQTMAALTGAQCVNGVHYEFGQNGALCSGAWTKTPFGTRYYYGPSYYYRGWQNINGNMYFFKDGYILTGSQCVADLQNPQFLKWYDFGEDGVAKAIPTGLYFASDGAVYYTDEDGDPVSGLIKIGGDTYYFDGAGIAVTNQTINGIEFGSDGKSLNGVYKKENGIYYYVDGVISSETSGQIQVNGETYYVINGQAVTGIFAGREYGLDGKALNGRIKKTDGLYYYSNGVLTASVILQSDGLYCYMEGNLSIQAGLVNICGDYYLVGEDGKCKIGLHYAAITNCDLPSDSYEFGVDGRMLQGITVKEGGVYYYLNGKIAASQESPLGLIKSGNDYCYVDINGVCKTGPYYASVTNCDLPCDTYEFGNDGKMLQGFVTKQDGVYYYTNGQAGRYDSQVGLIEVDGNYFYVTSGGRIVVNNDSFYVEKSNGLLLQTSYLFGADGRIIGFSPSADTPTPEVENMFMVCDRVTDDIIVYDLDRLNFAGSNVDLDDAEVWRCNLNQFGLEDAPEAYGAGASGLKFREDTVYGDVILVTSGTKSGIIKYPEGELIWKADYCGRNSHSIEILPSGNIVCAVADFTTGGNMVRLHYASQILSGDTEGAKRSVEYPLNDAHGVLWDPEYNCLWAIGYDELVAYAVSGGPGEEVLTKIDGFGGDLPTPYGHDLSADMTDHDYLYVTTASGVFRFNKATGNFETDFQNRAKLTCEQGKGFGNNPNGNFVYTYVNYLEGSEWANEQYASWSTNVITYAYWEDNGLFQVKEISAPNKIFYKARIFYGQYQ